MSVPSPSANRDQPAWMFHDQSMESKSFNGFLKPKCTRSLALSMPGFDSGMQAERMVGEMAV